MSTPNSEKIALVTGSTSGIGQATAELLGQIGYHVVVTGRDAKRGQAVCQGIVEANGLANFIQADLTQQEQAEKLVADAAQLSDIGKIAVLVNCVGGNKPGMTSEEHFAANYWAPRSVIKAAADYMREGGSIVNVTSICSESKQAHERGTYSDAKAALTSYTYGATAKLAREGIRVNIVAPGLTRTPDTNHITGQDRQSLIENMPLSERFLEPQDVAKVICDIVQWPFVTGQTIAVDAGTLAVKG